MPMKSIEHEVDAIRQVVKREGGCTVTCDELQMLCPNHLSVTEQYARIAAIAQQESWSFAFRSDGSVHFGARPPA